MCRISRLVLAVLTALVAAGLAAPAFATQDPPGCNANTLSLSLNRSTGQAVPGEVVTFQVFVSVAAVDGAGVPACNTVNVDVSGLCPDSTGSPVPPPIVLATGQAYSVGTSNLLVGSFQCTMPTVTVTKAVTARAVASGLLLDTDLLPGSDFNRQNDITVTVTPCSVQVDKQISCQGGSFFDVGLNPPDDGALGPICPGTTQVLVRYQVKNNGASRLFGCTLTESNSSKFGAPPAVTSPIASGETTAFLSAPNTPTCTDAVQGVEPDTATVSCFCTANLDPNLKKQAQDTATVSCKNPTVQVDKQISCDGGTTWADQGLQTANGDGSNGCTAPTNQTIRVRYFAKNTGDADLTGCVITETNSGQFGVPPAVGAITVGSTVGPFAAPSTPICTNADPGEPDLATINCSANIGGVVVPVTANDGADLTCKNPTVQVDKQISCDGGTTWVDQGLQTANGDGSNGCTAPGNQAIRVRYFAKNTGDADLTGCVITETNSAQFGVPPAVGAITVGSTVGPFAAPSTPTCTNAKPGEPDLATINCSANIGGVVVPVTANDGADLTCRNPTVQVDKQISCDGGTTWADQGLQTANGDGSNGCTAPGNQAIEVRYFAKNTGDADLTGCVITETNSAQFGVPPAVGAITVGSTAGPFAAPSTPTCTNAKPGEPDLATINCSANIGGVVVPVTANDGADLTCKNPTVQVDKQISCDGGTTWADQGLQTANGDGSNGCTAPGNQAIEVRYFAKNTGDADLTGCVITETNSAQFGVPPAVGAITVGSTVGPFAAPSTPTCTNAKPGEPDLATINCSANIGGVVVPVTANDGADLTCKNPTVQVDKQISCDGGTTWADQGLQTANGDGSNGCSAPTNRTIRVRYFAKNTGDADLTGCVITETNSGQFGVPPAVGAITVGSTVGPFAAPSTPICTNAKPGEPDLATINCSANVGGVVVPVTANDGADLACTAVCGDGVINQTCETCDGNDFGGHPHVNPCRTGVDTCGTVGCTYCGDGLVNGPPGAEQCDDGNTTNGDGCNNDCTAPCSVTVSKTVAPDDGSGGGTACDGVADGPFVETVTVDKTSCVVYQICVTNTGQQDLDANGVKVSDPVLGTVDFDFGPITVGAAPVCKQAPGVMTAPNCTGGNPAGTSCICENVEGVNTATITSAICHTTNQNACAQTGSNCSDTATVACLRPGSCRMTGGHNFDVVDAEFDENGKVYTTGGQIGAPQVNGCCDLPPKGKCVAGSCTGGLNGGQACSTNAQCPNDAGRNSHCPWGDWEHNHHSGPDDSGSLTGGTFAFHSGTAAAPNEAFIKSVLCADAGWCVQARPAPFKQIFWEGTGVFHNEKSKRGTDVPLPNFQACGTNQPVPYSRTGGTLHYYKAHVADFGEPAGINQKPADGCVFDDTCADPEPDGTVEISREDDVCPSVLGDVCLIQAETDPVKTALHPLCLAQSCSECPDLYEIEIHCTTDPASPVAYRVSHFIRQGNFQLHPPVGDSCNPTCGDGVCEGGVTGTAETCQTCPADCGPCRNRLTPNGR